jgi:hypothetical protein
MQRRFETEKSEDSEQQSASEYNTRLVVRSKDSEAKRREALQFNIACQSIMHMPFDSNPAHESDMIIPRLQQVMRLLNTTLFCRAMQLLDLALVDVHFLRYRHSPTYQPQTV